MVIKRGQTWITNFDPGFATELHKNRPAVVISIDEINTHHPRVVVIPVSTKKYLGPIVVPLLANKTTGLDEDSVVLPAEIRAIDKVRLKSKIGKLSPNKIKEIEESIKLVLGLTAI